MVSESKNHDAEVPLFVTEGNTIVKQFGTQPLYTFNLKQLECVFKAWMWQQSQQTPAEPVAATQYLTRAEAAERLHISLVTLDKYAKVGILPRRRVGSRYLYDPAEVDAAVTNKVR